MLSRIGIIAAVNGVTAGGGYVLATMCDVRFASPKERHAFADELAAAVAGLVRKYHVDDAEGGRDFRFYLGAYPRPKA